MLPELPSAPERPQVEARPCPACGKPVDPLRAPRLVWLEDGARFLCSEACRLEFIGGSRDYDLPSSPPPTERNEPRTSIPDLVRGATSVLPAASDTEPADTEIALPERDGQAWIATGLSVLAVGIAVLDPGRATVWLVGVLIVGAALIEARVPVGTVRASRIVENLAPAGLGLAALALVTGEGPASRWSMIGLGVAALALSVRRWVHHSMSGPVAEASRELLRTLPDKARVPILDQTAYEEVPAEGLRQGDLVVVLEGETVPADGVVERGTGAAFQYPTAALSRIYAEGDFLLAGTRVLEGAITLRVRRAGRQRGVTKAAELASQRRQDRPLAWRAAWAINQWSWALLVPVGLALWVVNGLESVAAVALGLPLLAWLAALALPIKGAALAAARRGMFFGSPRALRDAGRVRTTAILLRGALTAREPIVQQVHKLGSTDLAELLFMAASAERVVADHPIALAIRRHASEHGVAGPTIRRASARPGLGVAAVTQSGSPLLVGRRQLLLDEGVSVASADGDAALIENEGLTPIFIALDGRLEALLAILDPMHVGAKDAVQRILDLPSEVVLLSGDDRKTVERAAAQLGATGVKAPLLPNERVAEVFALREAGGVVAAIGRGGDDDGVLAAADIPVPLRLAGSTLEDRGVAVASHDVRDAAGALWIARAARRTTLRSLLLCAATTYLVLVGALFDWLTPATAALVALGTEAASLRAGSRLLRRVDLRVPTRQTRRAR